MEEAPCVQSIAIRDEKHVDHADGEDDDDDADDDGDDD